jgi:hypothetical protein
MGGSHGLLRFTVGPPARVFARKIFIGVHSCPFVVSTLVDKIRPC